MPALAAEEVEEKELSVWQTARWALEFDAGVDVQVLACNPTDPKEEYIMDMGVAYSESRDKNVYRCSTLSSEPVERDMIVQAYRIGVAGKWSPWYFFQATNKLRRDDTFHVQDLNLTVGDD